MSNKSIIQDKKAEDKKIDPYKWQKNYYRNNKQKLNQQRVVLNYRKKYGAYLNNKNKIDIFKKHKKIYLQLKDLDKDMLLYFLNK